MRIDEAGFQPTVLSARFAKLGLDVLHVANEGRFIAFVRPRMSSMQRKYCMATRLPPARGRSASSTKTRLIA